MVKPVFQYQYILIQMLNLVGLLTLILQSINIKEAVDFLKVSRNPLDVVRYTKKVQTNQMFLLLQYIQEGQYLKRYCLLLTNILCIQVSDMIIKFLEK